MGKYDNIINLPHHVSKKHPRLSIEQRAAQFAPFAALRGYGEEIKESSRITEDRIELDDEEKQKIAYKILDLKNIIHHKPTVTVTFFVPDIKKMGGEYVTKVGNLKRIDEYKKSFIFEDKTEILINEIIEIL